MKKHIFLSVMFLAALASCTSELENIFTAGEVTTIHVSAQEFQAITRTSIDKSNHTVKWSEGDIIGIFPMVEESSQIAFKICNGSGTSIAAFEGKGWGLKNGTYYSAYYPLNHNALLDKESILLDYTGQKQTGNNSTAHLGAFDYMYAASTTPINGSLNLKFNHIGTLLHFQIPVASSKTYTKVIISTDGEFYTQANLNLKTNTITKDNDSKTRKLELALNNVSTGTEETILNVYLMVLPVNLTGHMITVNAYDEEGDVFCITWDGMDLCAGNYEDKLDREFVIPYLTFSAEQEQTLKMSKPVATLEFSVNGGNWQELGTNEVSFGGFFGNLRLRGKSYNGTATDVTFDNSQISFGSSSPVYSSGDIRTLIDYENYSTVSTANARFCYLFRDCTALVSAPDLPSEHLAEFCYYMMFDHCTNLILLPELNSNHLEKECYGSMFQRCSSITQSPKLPAMTMKSGCYENMFCDCINLKNAPDLPSKNLSEWCYYNMFSGCSSLTKAPSLPAMELKERCYSDMFFRCSNLTDAPVLGALALAKYCYSDMFYQCNNLHYVKMMATDISASSCLAGWANYMSSSGILVKNANAIWDESGVIPSGWTVQTATE